MRKNKCFEIVIIMLLLLPFGSVQAQKSLNKYKANQIWQLALYQYNHQNYGVAKKEFANYLIQAGEIPSIRRTEALFYSAACSVQLGAPDARQEIESFIRNYPWSNKKQEAYLLLANQQFRQRNYREALSSYRKIDADQLDKKQAMAYRFKMGYSYFKLKNYDKAHPLFAVVKSGTSGYQVPATYYYSHIAYLNGKYQTALNGFEQLKENADFKGIVPYYICQIYYLKEKYDKLLAYAPDLLEKKKIERKAEIAKMIGLSYYQKKAYKDAIPYLKKGKKTLNRNERFAYGYCMYREKEYAEAIPQLERVSGKDDEIFQVANYCLADCYIQTNNKTGAKAAFASAARLDFDKNIAQDALFNYAKITYELSYSPFNETINAFDDYLQKYPGSDRNDMAYDYLVKVYMTTKNYREALISMDKIQHKTIQIKQAYQRVAWLRGLELLKQLQYENAVNMLDKSLQYKIFNTEIAADCIYWKADAQYRLGNLEEAIHIWQQFLVAPGAGLSPYFNRATYNIAYAKFQQSDYTGALEGFQKFVNQSKTQSKFVTDAYNRIADCLFLNRNYPKAAAYYAKAVENADFDTDYALYQQAVCLGLMENQQAKADLLQQLSSNYSNSDYNDDALFELAKARTKMGNDKAAIELYKQLITQNPNSSYAAKSYLQLGQFHYNLREYKKAISSYKKVITNFPQSEESKSALIGLKNVYIDLNRVNDYFKFAEKVSGGVTAPASEQDSLTYLSAERLYLAGRSNEGAEAFANYLNVFPDGKFRINATFYKAEADLNNKNYAVALQGFERVLESGNPLFLERALAASAQLNYREKKLQKAEQQFSQLLDVATISENNTIARIGCMRTNFQLKQYAQTVIFAGKVLDISKLQQEEKREATYMKAKSNYELKYFNKALPDLKELAKESVSEQGAEAKYLLAKIAYEQKNYDEAEKQVDEFIEMNSPQQYWLAESFLLLSDVFMHKNDAFQARYTLQSIIDNYGNKTDGIIERAKEKIALIKEEESN